MTAKVGVSSSPADYVTLCIANIGDAVVSGSFIQISPPSPFPNLPHPTPTSPGPIRNSESQIVMAMFHRILWSQPLSTRRRSLKLVAVSENGTH